VDHLDSDVDVGQFFSDPLAAHRRWAGRRVGAYACFIDFERSFTATRPRQPRGGPVRPDRAVGLEARPSLIARGEVPRHAVWRDARRLRAMPNAYAGEVSWQVERAHRVGFAVEISRDEQLDFSFWVAWACSSIAPAALAEERVRRDF